MSVKSLALVIALLAMCTSIIAISDYSDASDDPAYGSTIEPYGGIRSDYESLDDGVTFFVIKGGSIYIDCQNANTRDLDSALIGTGLTYDDSTESIWGYLNNSCTITIEDKTVHLEAVNAVYGDYPIYGVVNMDPIPDATIGEYYYQRVVLFEGGVGIGSHTYIVYTEEFDPTPYGLSITFEYKDSAIAGGYVAAIISGTPSTTVDTEIVIRSSSHSWSYQEYRIPFQINKPVYTITLDPGNGTCSVPSLTYSSADDDGCCQKSCVQEDLVVVAGLLGGGAAAGAAAAPVATGVSVIAAARVRGGWGFG